ncbi:general transcription factor 3C polypeptide 1 [Drosophila tropicalis]|uniref:general transcription factor 3C polypeptide 1 n=1 Tax=Drosophila tropicalis TaxID=46794 RepID=UPI0035AC1B1F
MCAPSSGSWNWAIFDEVALEGLEGVTLPSLWSLLAIRLQVNPDPFPPSLQEQIWTLLLKYSPAKVEFFELPSPRPFIAPYDRKNDVDPEEGVPLVPEKCPFMLYPEAMVEDNEIMGNCVDYKTRKPIAVDELKQQTASEATEKWNQRLVIVASQELRLIALTPANLIQPDEYSLQQYVFWEAIGRSRYNGMTTVGPWSLSCYCRDAGFVFYIKNKLLEMQLIDAQPYNERHKGRFLNSVLLHLPRFFRIYKNRVQESIEQLYLTIKESPAQHIPIVEIADHLRHLNSSQVKKLLVTHLFRSYFETIHVLLPSRKPNTKSAKRKCAVLQLRNPNLKFEDLYQVNQSSEGTEPTELPTPNDESITTEIDVSNMMNSLLEPSEANDSSYEESKPLVENTSKAPQNENEFDEELDEMPMPDFLDQKHSYIDMPAEQECYEAIMRFGKRGISQAELAQYVSINMQTVRGFVKHLLKEGQIKDYTEQIGKQRAIRYVASVQGAHVDLKKVEMEKTIQELRCKDEFSTPRNSDIVLKDHPEITSTVRPITIDIKRYKIEKQMERQVYRKTLIVRLIDENCIMQMYNMMRNIQKEEQNAGYSDSICRRSVLRLLQPMSESKVVNVYEISLQYGQRVRLYRLVTHPKITADHELLHREILRLKNNFHLMSEERQQRAPELSPKDNKKEPQRKKPKGSTQIESTVSKVPAPKLLLAKALHEFLYYLIVELDRERKPLKMTKELVSQWQKTEPALQPRQFLEEWQAKETYAMPYNDEISWRTFIPPLPRYEDKPQGWIYFTDAMERMPLSLFLRICRIERDAMDKLRNQLKHPVRQHYLISQLDSTYLVPRLRIQQLYLTTLRLLNQMGLLQIGEREMGCDLLQRWVYLNRRSRLLDTTTSNEHNYKRVSADHMYMELKFEFENRDFVAKYWAKLQHICIYTKLGFRKHMNLMPKTARNRSSLNFLDPVGFEKALELDTGFVPGDQLGAGGIDSSIYAHQFRHWSWVQNKGFKSETNSPTTAASGASKSSNPGRKRMPTIARLKPTHKLQMRKSRPAQPGGSAQSPAKRKSGPRDDVDRDALRNMRTLRVAWSPQEDRLLKMGRAVYLFIDAPMPALALCNVGIVCRDIIRRHLGICNKTTQACVRRLQFLMRMKRDLPEVPNWIYSMQTSPQFRPIYHERFLANLKRDYSSKTERNEALVIHFVLILTKLHGMINNAHGMMCRQFLLPDDLNDYKLQFRECSPLNADQQLLYRNPSTESELQVMIAVQVLHSTLCSAKDKTLFNLQTFEIYKHFSEEVLNAAFNKARADSLLVAVKRRNIQTVNRSLSGPAHLLSSKYKYRLIYLKLGYAVYDTYYQLSQKMQEEHSEVQLPSPNFGQFLLMGEWLALGSVRINLQLPANILTVDTTSMSRNTGSSTDRILDHYSCIFDNAPQTEYAKRLESECSGRQASRVRFHPANLSYRLPYSPYNHLSKLPLRAMHFFCALDALGESVSINSSRLEQSDFCPFAHCIMRSGNYLNAVERIVHERRPLLRELMANSSPWLESNTENFNSSPVVVAQTNLWGLVHHLETFWRQHQQILECKDLGKVLADKTLHKLTDWRSICLALLDYEPSVWETERTQEYEPALNKEERARAQDVFVVHLPMIRIESMESIQKLEEAKEMINTMRKSIIDKVTRFTYWSYTENTFETLRPNLLTKNYDATSIEHMESILNYIEKQPLGVLCTELRDTFKLGSKLLQFLGELIDHALLKRVGVENHMYVHKEHIRNWVVHTFHIKRLEREKLQNEVAAAPATPQAVVGEKRKMKAEHEDDDPEPTTSKKIKLKDENSTENESDEVTMPEDDAVVPKRFRRRSKPREISPPSEVSRDVIVMRPQPWIRVNASLNRRVLDRWLGAVLSECIARFGCTVYSLFLRFPHLVPVDIMLLIELLRDMGCLDLMELIPSQHIHVETLATDWELEDEQTEQLVTEIYDPKDTYVRVRADAIRHLTNFIGIKKYNAEFI